MFGQDAAFDMFEAGLESMGGERGNVACNLIDDKNRICTEMMQGGPDNITYVGGFALLTPTHRLIILSNNGSGTLEVSMDGIAVVPNATQEEIAYEYSSPGDSPVNVYWQTRSNVIAVVTDFMSKRVWSVDGTAIYPAHIQVEDLLRPVETGALGVDPNALRNPVVTTFAGRSFTFAGQNGRTYCLISQMNHQLSARTYTAGPANHTAYVEGIGFMYKEHRVLVELASVTNETAKDKTGIVVFVNETRISAPPREDNFAVRLEYPCADGTALHMVWQVYRPILGNTIELTTDMMKVRIWLLPGRTFENGTSVPPFLNADATLLHHEPGTTAMQGVLGEAYDHLLAGDAIEDPNNPLHYPDDGQFHGLAPRPVYRMADYFDTNHTFNLFGATEYTPEALAYRQAAGLTPALDATGAAIQATRRTSQRLRVAVICLGIFAGLVLVAGGAYVTLRHRRVTLERLDAVLRRLRGLSAKYGKMDAEAAPGRDRDNLTPAPIDRSPAQSLAYTIASSASSNWKYGDLRAELRQKGHRHDDEPI